ncbi:related to CTD kinase subunit gamma [Cephalotrichum gorgonifer]|uniref:Related to CTD kinase subunit gamma n=1 Tax=Cephalotrichum gorgonifer TaxID=2041049 RepID=A0AAE8SU06_9PEZI|nr:related to CTD kinase subunit gamma [Cephalotrichum gorgonifer]
MADPFEVRMRFTKQLQHLNASVTAAQKAAQYALRYKDMDEDLHSCIVEQLEQNRNMNTRANIMYFIEQFLQSARKDGHENYVRMMQRDIIRVVDAVAPDDGTGSANVKVIRRVLSGLCTKGFFQDELVTEIEECLRDRVSKDFEPASPAVEGGGSSGQSAKRKADARHVEQRIEEDRERHKRLRETMWAVPGDRKEWEKQWEETSDWGSDDDTLAVEEAEMRGNEWAFYCPHYKVA